MLLYLLIVFIFLVVLRSFLYFPTLEEHMKRNNFNELPTGKLTLLTKNKYIDEANKIWYRRSFLGSILHHPSENYVFEEYSEKSSSEVLVNKKDFERGSYERSYKPGSFNYYSSLHSPLRHFVADVLPLVIY